MKNETQINEMKSETYIVATNPNLRGEMHKDGGDEPNHPQERGRLWWTRSTESRDPA